MRTTLIAVSLLLLYLLYIWGYINTISRSVRQVVSELKPLPTTHHFGNSTVVQESQLPSESEFSEFVTSKLEGKGI